MISSTHGPMLPDHTGRPTNNDETQNPRLVLEIRSGQTRFPLRPVQSNRFLIGAGEGCDLRLGGDDMPPLHSIVHVDHVETLLETVAQSPPLQVNGVEVESVLIQDGDQIDIGPFQFIAHRPESAAKRAVQAPPQNGLLLIHENQQELPETDIADLSATELVALIEAEERQVEEFEQRQQLSANALLDAVAERLDETATPIEDSTDTTDEEFAPLLLQANELASELERQTANLSEREAVHTELAEAVFESQQELATRLETLVSRIIKLEEQQRPQYPKVA